jgi:hypothetical protein
MFIFNRFIVTTFLLFTFFIPTKAQTTDNILEKQITINANGLTIKEVLKTISVKTGIGFSYRTDMVLFSQKVTLNVTEKSLKEILNQIFSNTKITYSVVGNQIVFQEKTQQEKHTISGYVQDKESGEKLIGCFVLDSINHRGVVTNSFGYFSLYQTEGKCSISAHYFGYSNQLINLNVTRDTAIIIKLSTRQPINLAEVEITNSISEAKLSRPQMGLMNVSSKDVKKMPVLLGEADVMRAIQMLPGIQAANERSTGISVRGGSIDQNLFLLDDAPVFQISHMIGFYSVFNNDAIKDIKVYKGDIPANYGGRISSLVDIRLKDGNMQNYVVSGGIGIIASNLSIEGPILKNRVSFIVSGKYSYTGLLLKLMNPSLLISFYDLNCKLNAIVNPKNRIYISSYNGGDNARLGLHSSYHNNTMSLRWNYVYSPKLFCNISLIYSNYNFKSGSTDNINESANYTWRSGIKQTTLKAEYNYYLNNNHTIDFGASTTYNDFIPGKLEGNEKVITDIAQSTPFNNRVVNEQAVIDHVLYISNLQKITDHLSIRYGLRGSLYQNLGGHWVYKLTNYQVTDSFYAAKNSTYANYFSIEPRISANYRISEAATIKASYTYTTQQTQLIIKTTGGGPLDVWFPSGINIKPQTSSQYSLGYVHYFLSGLLEASIEGYYKNMKHIIDYKDGATFLEKSSVTKVDKTNYNFEEQLRTGRGYSYGTEFMLKLAHSKADGFVSYTYARSKRVIPGINFGETYLSPFDRPHTFDIFVNYNLTKRMSLSANFRRQSGQVTTIPIYIMEMFGKTFKGYSKRNEYRLPYYQRLDLSLTLKGKEKAGRRNHGEWNFSVINVLNNANITYIDFEPSTENTSIIIAKGISILGIVPSVSYHFNF